MFLNPNLRTYSLFFPYVAYYNPLSTLWESTKMSSPANSTPSDNQIQMSKWYESLNIWTIPFLPFFEFVIYGVQKMKLQPQRSLKHSFFYSSFFFSLTLPDLHPKDVSTMWFLFLFAQWNLVEFHYLWQHSISPLYAILNKILKQCMQIIPYIIKIELHLAYCSFTYS